MDAEIPSSLPTIDAVEIVDLRGVRVNHRVVDEYMANARAAPTWRLDGSDAQRIATLWRSLPAGEQARCHIPPFGFRFFAAGHVVAEASVCWQCNNLSGTAGDRRLFFEFDSSAPPARELLAAAERATGIRVVE